MQNRTETLALTIPSGTDRQKLDLLTIAARRHERRRLPGPSDEPFADAWRERGPIVYRAIPSSALHD